MYVYIYMYVCMYIYKDYLREASNQLSDKDVYRKVKDDAEGHEKCS